MVTTMPHLIEQRLNRRLHDVRPPLAVVLPSGKRLGPSPSRVTLAVRDLAALPALALGHIGQVGAAYVEKQLDFEGSMRDVCAVAAGLMRQSPTQAPAQRWWREVRRQGKSLVRHTASTDAKQVQFHYDLNGQGSDDFFGLWLDERRVYSCAYYAEPHMSLAQAQAAKLDLVCRKLMLKPGERLLDIGAGWGALLVWAAEHYGVQAHGITLSEHQLAYVQTLIADKGLGDRVSISLCDYRDLDEQEPYDKIASIGMFEHVGLAHLPTYFGKLRSLLKPGGLLLNHGITAGGTRNAGLGAGIAEFVERYIFPGGELVHTSLVLQTLAEAELEALDLENLRPHYARTLWAWSDAFEANLARARELSNEAVVRAYRLYLAGSAMAFERGWISLHQILASKPTGDLDGFDTNGSGMRGAQSAYPFRRDYMYPR